MKKILLLVVGLVTGNMLSGQCTPPLSLPYSEDFNSGLGCFTVTNGGSTADTWLQQTPNYDPDVTSLDGTNFAIANSDVAPNSAYLHEILESPAIDASSLTGSLILDFDQFFRSVGQGESGEIQVYDGSAWVTVYNVAVNTGSGTAPDHQTLNLTSYANANFKLRFIYDDNSAWAWYWMIDNVQLRDITCPDPLGITIISLTDTSASITFPGNRIGYGINYDTLGFTQGTGTLSYGSDDTITITGLSNGTSYDFYVRSVCNATDTSAWVGPISFTTSSCPALPLPFSEVFSSSSTTENCWTVLDENNDGDQWDLDYTSNSLTGGQVAALYTDGNGGNNDDYLISPSLTLTGNEILRFSYRVQSANEPNDFELLLSKSGIAPAGFSDTLIPLTSYSNTTYQEILVDLSAYSGNYNLAWHVPAGGLDGWRLYIDSVVVETAPPCLQPLYPTVDLVTASTAQISFSANGSSFEYAYDTAGFVLGTERYTTSGTTTTQTLSSLSDNTTYDVYIRQNCTGSGNGYSIWIGPVTFTTSCLALPVPFSEDFSSSSTTENCWTVLNKNNDVDFWDLNYTTNPLAGDQVAMLYTDGNGGNNNDYLVSPALTLSGNEQLRFSYRVQSSGEPNDFQLLLSTTGKNPADFTDTLVPIASYSNTTYQEMLVNLSSFSGDCYLAWHVPAGGLDGWRLYIDSVVVEALPPCPEITDLQVTSATASSFTIGFNTFSGATFDVEYGPSGFTPGTGCTKTLTGTNSLTINSSTGTNCSIDPNTYYDVYIRNNCTASSDGYSTWSGPVTFATPCLPVTAPYLEDFNSADWAASTSSSGLGDTISNCWKRTPVSGAGYAFVVRDASTPSGSTGPAGDYSGGGNYIVTEASSGSSGDMALFVSPLINVSALSVPQLRFFYHAYGANIDTLHIDVADQNGWTNSVDKVTKKQLASSDPWEPLLVDLSAFGDTLQVRFRIESQGCCAGDLGIDNFEIRETPPCPDPIGFSISGITDTSATVTFTDTNSSFQYNWGPQGFTQGSGTVAIGGNPFTITGLTSSSAYDIYIRTDCGTDGFSNFIGPYTFTTLCAAQTAPFIETFEDNSLSVSCWRNQMISGNKLWTIGTGSTGGTINTAYAGTKNARFTASSDGGITRFLSPLLDMTSLSNPALKFWYAQQAWGADQNFLNVYFKEHPDSSWVLIFSDSTNKSTWTEADMLLPNTATLGQLAFEGDDQYGYGNILDNIAVYDQVPADFSLESAKFKKDFYCYSATDTIQFEVINELSDSVDFTITPLTINYQVTGPVNTSSSVTVNTGTLKFGDTLTVLATDIDLSIPGDYVLQLAYLDSNAINQDIINDTLINPTSIKIDTILTASPDMYVFKNANDSIEIKAKSPFFSGGSFFITEQSQYKSAVTGWPAYLNADDYIEITGVPGSDLGGITYEQWNGTSLIYSYTFPSGTLLSPNGTAIIGVGEMTAGMDSPSDFYYQTNYTGFSSSGDPLGKLLRDASGNIIDAVIMNNYTWPVASGVTAADWTGTVPGTGSTAGSRLVGPDLNNSTGWVTAASVGGQDPNVVNSGVSVPNPSSISGFSWMFNSSLYDTIPNTWVYADSLTPGTYEYVATYVSPCGITYNDTVTVFLGTCFPPLSLGADSISGMAAKLFWETQNPGALHQVEYGMQGFTQGTGMLATASSDSSTVVSGLTPLTDYCYYVRTVCGPSDTSGWAGPYCFMTDVSCPPSTNLTATALSSNSVQLDWTPGNGSVSYTIEYDTAGFQPGSGRYILTTTSIPFTISSLTSNTAYDFYVIDSCGVGNIAVTSAGPASVRTFCDPVAAPFIETFESSSPTATCWSNEIVSGDQTWTINTGSSGGTITYANNGTLNARFTATAGTDISRFISPVIDMTSLSNPYLKFWYAQEDWSGDQNYLNVYFREHPDSSWTLVFSDSTEKDVYTKALTALPSVSATAQIALEGIDEYGYANVVDDIEIYDSLSCSAPTGLAAIASGCDSITMNWTSASGTSIIEYGPVGFTPGSGTMVGGITSGSYTLTSLVPGSSYDFYVMDDCGSDTSSAMGPVSVSTATGPLPSASILITDTVVTTSDWTVSLDGGSTTGATSYSWSLGNGSTSSAGSATATYTANGTYTVTLVAENACGTDTATVNIVVSGLTGLEENAISRSLNVYPNPANHHVNIKFDGATSNKAIIRLMDASGRETIRMDENINGHYDGQLDVSKLSKGIYLIEIQSGDMRAQRRLSVN